MARISDLDCARCAVLEADPVKALVEVDGVLPGHHLHNRDIYIYYWLHPGNKLTKFPDYWIRFVQLS